MANIDDVFGTDSPNDSFNLREVKTPEQIMTPENSYRDLREVIDRLFSDNRRVHNKPYNP